MRMKVKLLTKGTPLDSRQFDAVPAKRLHDIEHTLMTYDVIGIDEGQFVSFIVVAFLIFHPNFSLVVHRSCTNGRASR